MPGDNNKGAFVVTSTQNHQIIHLYHEQILFWYQKGLDVKPLVPLFTRPMLLV